MSRQMNCRLFSALKKVAFFSFIILMGACDFNGTKKSDKKDKSSDQDIVYETAVLADVEGSWEKVKSFLSHSNIVTLEDDDPVSPKAKLADHGKFVFLGDAIDHGPNPVKVLNFLLNLKERYPDRVFLILGNRDINKLRFNWELTDAGLKLDDAAAQGDLSRFRVAKWSEKFASWSASDASEIDGVQVDYQHGQDKEADRILKLKWMLTDTFGAVNSFKNYKIEAGIQSDRDAMTSYLALTKKDGLLAKYLKKSQLIYLDDDSETLYVHGGLNRENVGVIPKIKSPSTDLKNWFMFDGEFKGWIAELNQWAQKSIDAGIEGDGKAAIDLVEYQEPPVVSGDWKGFNNRSVILARPWVKGSNLGMIDDEMTQWLKNQGVKRLVFGHSPVGDLPVFMKKNGFEMVACDTSYAGSGENATVSITKDQVLMTSRLVQKDPQTRAVTLDVLVKTNSQIASHGSFKVKTVDQKPDRLIWTIGELESGKAVRGYWYENTLPNGRKVISPKYLISK